MEQWRQISNTEFFQVIFISILWSMTATVFVGPMVISFWRVRCESGDLVPWQRASLRTTAPARVQGLHQQTALLLTVVLLTGCEESSIITSMVFSKPISSVHTRQKPQANSNWRIVCRLANQYFSKLSWSLKQRDRNPCRLCIEFLGNIRFCLWVLE